MSNATAAKENANEQHESDSTSTPASATKTKHKQAKATKKPGSKPTTERANKKAEVIDMMKRAKGATLAEIMKATGWQANTVPASSASDL